MLAVHGMELGSALLMLPRAVQTGSGMRVSQNDWQLICRSCQSTFLTSWCPDGSASGKPGSTPNPGVAAPLAPSPQLIFFSDVHAPSCQARAPHQHRAVHADFDEHTPQKPAARPRTLSPSSIQGLRAGPLAYNVSGHMGRQELSERETAPGWRMGTEKRFVSVEDRRAAEVPGPGQYSAPRAVGPQINSNKRSLPAVGFGKSGAKLSVRPQVSAWVSTLLHNALQTFNDQIRMREHGGLELGALCTCIQLLERLFDSLCLERNGIPWHKRADFERNPVVPVACQQRLVIAY